MKAELEISLSRGSSGLFYLRITDATSRVLVTEMAINAEQFADMLSTRPTVVPASLYVDAANRWGQEMEVGHVDMPFRSDHFSEDVSEFEPLQRSTGWHLDVSPNERDGYPNHHRIKNDQYSFSRRRWVPKQTEVDNG